MPTSERQSALLGLPWLVWVGRFDSGEVHLRGRLVVAVEIGAALLQPGPIEVMILFCGGITPSIVRADVVATGLKAALNPQEVEDLLGNLWDLEFCAKGFASAEMDLRFGPGIRVHIPAHGLVRASGAAVGPPHALVLSGPLQLSAGEARLQFEGGRRLRWVSSLASVRLSRAVLHPDGRVALEGGARRGFELAVRGGLSHASTQLSLLVRHSPRFDRVRSFLPT